MSDELSELSAALKKQSRALVATQAAAEACLEGVAKLEQKLGAPAPVAKEPVAKDSSADWIRTLLPAWDALDVVVSESHRLEEAPVSWIARTFAKEREAEMLAFARALKLLATQLEGTLERCGVTVDRATGIPFDAERHRVIETRKTSPGEAPGVVVAVIRPGYSFEGKRVREADVVVGAAHE
ncbi:MAG: nucleotide exchange factor GrpE [Deltaproteobacteria bacterium]|nr:nucleotide exchange factor GrpE [Deltaproteobacteria bacterium]